MPKPDFTVVQSDNIAAIGHDGETNTLYVQFKRKGQRGATYSYTGVTPEHFEKFRNADSLGGHFAEHIKGKFEYTKLPEETAQAGS